MLELSPALEDYLEAILILKESRKNVRVKDLAAFMDVKAPSVSDALNTLKQKGFVEQEPYGAVDLTSPGLLLAGEIYARHKTLNRFFREVIGLSQKDAEEEACKIEHYLSKDTVRKMLRFIEQYVPPGGRKA